MSKKPKHERAAPFELKRHHVLIGVAVVAASAIAAIAIVTFFGGSSLSEGQKARLPLPTAIGSRNTDRSAAADLLASKPWDDMTPDDHALIRNEFIRTFDSGSFRFSSPLVRASDVFRSGGHTRITRNFTELKSAGNTNTFLVALSFYCVLSPTMVTSYRYSTSNGSTELTENDVDPKLLPFDPFVYNLDWSSVSDLGFTEIDGRRAHGFRIPFSPPSGLPALKTEYWLDVETAQLLKRIQYRPDGTAPDPNLVYTLDWRQYGVPVVPEGQQRPGCVDAVAKAFGGQ